jgi:hypothetical protein
MTNLETQPQYKPNWKYIVGVLVAWNLFEVLLDRVWHVPYVISFSLFIPLAGLLLYFVLPKPSRKKNKFYQILWAIAPCHLSRLNCVGDILGVCEAVEFRSFNRLGWGHNVFCVFAKSVLDSLLDKSTQPQARYDHPLVLI